MNLHPSDLDQDELNIIISGCKQILRGIGFSENNPFTNLGVSGLHNLMNLFHFQVGERKTKHSFILNDKKGILDSISFKHYLDERTCLLYNFCNYEFEDGLSNYD